MSEGMTKAEEEMEITEEMITLETIRRMLIDARRIVGEEAYPSPESLERKYENFVTALEEERHDVNPMQIRRKKCTHRIR